MSTCVPDRSDQCLLACDDRRNFSNIFFFLNPMAYTSRIRIQGANTDKPVVRRELRDRTPSEAVKTGPAATPAPNASPYTEKQLQDEASRSGLDWATDETPTTASSVTGQPLEEPPSVKVRKEAFGGRRRGKGKGPKRSSTPDSLDQEDEEAFEAEERKYRAGLSTRRSDELTQLSTERDATHRTLRPVAKRPQEPVETNGQSRPRSRKRGRRTEGNAEVLSRRVKQTPRKKTNGQLVATTESVASPDEDPTVHNQDFCAACGLPGLFICCEGCPRSFHFQCLNPPASEDDLPDHWYCNECVASRQKPKKSHIGIFSVLLDELNTHNPLAFRLPREVAEAFEGVSMSKDGDFEDDNMKPPKTYSQLLAEAQDPLTNVYDKEGNPLFCYKCEKSGLNGRLLTRCDYCSLAWHLDCLDPPLTSAKMLGSKWMCPNHVETVNKSRRKLRHQPKVAVAMTRDFKAPRDANIDIINVEDYSVDELELEQTFPPDPVFQFRSTDNGTAYKLSRDLVRISKAEESENVTYQVKEEAIILDFIKGTKHKQQDEQRVRDLENLRLYERAAPQLRDYLLGVAKLSERSIITNRQKKLNLDELLKQIDDEYRLEHSELSKQELHELLIVKKLMELKGHDKLMEFLRS
ncbi:hypothetical protein KL936_004193 [Ogataea polymorpha]|nr:hypothetical protein KL936_004193 [Ogataea polymorpha]